MIKKIASWGITALLLVAIWGHQSIIDWWRLNNYDPPAKITQIAKDTTMTAEAKRLFYLSWPELNDKASFNTNCPSGELRQTLVLGCYAGGRIYILEIKDPKLEGVVPVTAAHEMLHAAYERLDSKTKNKIDQALSEFYPTIKDESFKQLIKEYQRHQPSQLNNELHSLLPTQVSKLPQELEDYYQRYFMDRQRVVDEFEDYEGVFKDINKNREELLRQVESLSVQIESTQARAEAAIARANELSAEINRLRAEGRVEESNQLVPAQNQAATLANSLGLQAQNLISEHNQLVLEINQLALIEQDLFNKIDSKVLEPVTPQSR